MNTFFSHLARLTFVFIVAIPPLARADAGRIVTGADNASPHVKAFAPFSRRDMSEVHNFLAYSGFTGGIFVAAGDVNGDGFDDIVTGTDSGATAHVKVFNGASGAELHSFFAYPANFNGGVRVAAGDLNGDGRAEIITGSGPGGAAHVKVFDGVSLAELRSFFAYSVSFTGGVFVAAGDVNGDGQSNLGAAECSTH